MIPSRKKIASAFWKFLKTEINSKNFWEQISHMCETIIFSGDFWPEDSKKHFEILDVSLRFQF